MIEIKTWEELNQCGNDDLKAYLRGMAKEYDAPTFIELVGDSIFINAPTLIELVGDSVFIVESLEDLKRLPTPDGSLYDAPFPMDSLISFVDKYSFFYLATNNGGGWLAVIPVELIRNFEPLRTTVRLTYD